MGEYYLNLEDIRKNWQVEPGDPRQNSSRWDRSAENYEKKPLPTAETSRAMRLLQEKDMWNAQSDILDVGCGAGRFSLAFAGSCRSVVGTDFSAGMIEAANRRKAACSFENVQFRRDNWHTLDLAREGWEHRFDLVFAHMTPAIHTYESFRKLEEASRGWCYLSKPTRQHNPLLQGLMEQLGLQGYRAFDYDMMYAYDALCMEGRTPMVDYEPTVWPYTGTVEEATAQYISKLEMKCTLDDAQRQEAEAYIRSYARDGMVHADTQVVVSMLYWHV